MLLSLALVLLVSLAASRAMKDAETLQSEMFPPTHPNCTQSLTDYLLLRQELQLSKMAAAEEERTQLTRENLQVLTQVRDTLSQVSEALTQRNQASGRSAAETPLCPGALSSQGLPSSEPSRCLTSGGKSVLTPRTRLAEIGKIMCEIYSSMNFVFD
ncbi:uncharacterized protein LOC134772707 [Penaeus indicus]|uniref:uncharacterized protein LOC134772707 n=1 Tax=Penaeus indicus TaxID=29960 RepID=UPI00300D1271